MADRALQIATNRDPLANPTKFAEPVREAGGYVVFSAGEVGVAHVMAHRLLDEGRIDLGHQRLGAWLDGRKGVGSQWVHLQFHMGVFELALGRWNDAYTRFMTETLPAATKTQDALTDAPALLWRLALSAPAPVELPWQAVHRTALSNLERSPDAFVELHHLLALAGASDLASIERWLQARSLGTRSHRDHIVYRVALALKAYVSRAYEQAAIGLARLAPFLSDLGGSHAQRQLFSEIERSSWQRVREAAVAPLGSGVD